MEMAITAFIPVLIIGGLLVGGIVVVVLLITASNRSSSTPPPPRPSKEPVDRKEVLERLKRKEISKEEAERLLAEGDMPEPDAPPSPSRRGAGLGCVIALIIGGILAIVVAVVLAVLMFTVRVAKDDAMERESEAIQMMEREKSRAIELMHESEAERTRQEAENVKRLAREKARQKAAAEAKRKAEEARAKLLKQREEAKRTAEAKRKAEEEVKRKAAEDKGNAE